MTSGLDVAPGAGSSTRFRRDGVYKTAELSRQPAVRLGDDGRSRPRPHPVLEQLRRPLRRSRGDRGREVRARPVRRRHGLGPLHLRHVHDPPGARAGARPLASAREAALSYVSCWTANEGLMPTVLDEQDVVISDALNHASIIDGVRLCKAARRVYKHSDMAEPQDDPRGNRVRANALRSSPTACSAWKGTSPTSPRSSRWRARTTRSSRSTIPTGRECWGATGRGTAEHHGLMGEIDVITSTLGKALGGAAGGFTAGSAARRRLPRRSDPVRSCSRTRFPRPSLRAPWPRCAISTPIRSA